MLLKKISPSFYDILIRPRRIGMSSIPSGAAGPGFEPRYPPSKGGVLPLDDPAALERIF